VGDYVWQGHLATADQHRAMFEAVNHRMWDITSGLTEWKLNSAWPDVQWQIFDWFLKPMVSYYFIKRANEPVHIQLGLIEPMVTVVNHTLAPGRGLKVKARVLDLSMRVLFEKQESVDVAANSYLEVFELPKLPALPPVYFVRLDLSNPAGKRISDNLYWFPAQKGGSMQALRTLPPVKPQATWRLASRGAEKVARVKVSNPTSQLAFFVQLALTQGRGGTEILPVLWEDNYFSLLPGESREVTATFASNDAGSAKTRLEIGGWNVESDFDCPALVVSRHEVKVGQSLTVTARISNTFLDGSRVPLYVNGAVQGSCWAWARGDASLELPFSLNFDQPGLHEIRVGSKRLVLRIPQ
jgi:hypothetical protein